MAATDTKTAFANEPVRPIVGASRGAVIVVVVAGVIALNLLIYLVGPWPRCWHYEH